LHQVGDLFELNVKLQCQMVKWLPHLYKQSTYLSDIKFVPCHQLFSFPTTKCKQEDTICSHCQ